MARFTPDFLDELKSRLRPSDVIGRYVKLKKQGNEWAGLSPFTNEKTPSFFVNDQKGFYHCFSSGQHGDIISFLQETQKLSFHEAVERLAEDAGLPLPVETPAEAARAEQAKGLAEACAAAAAYFANMLHRSDGRHALDYLYDRQVSDAQIEKFQIGYAPNGRNALKDYLTIKGFSDETLIEAGLVIKPVDGSVSYDRFRNRVMFPITGARQRVIAFGGRALDQNARAKYLNSPETPIFHKGSVLYNLDTARSAAAKDDASIIVCEGYMDVIALWGAGIKNAVAPLGTALTEDQLALLWRSSDEPVLCFDGDKAGIGAAYRAVDRAMPLLKPGKSLSFAFLPDGEDPDDVVRAGGASAMNTIVADAEPLVNVLWDREIQVRKLDTPERRAALRSHLRVLVKSIADKDVRLAYGNELGRRLDEQFQPPKRQYQSGGVGRNFDARRQGFRFAKPPVRPTPDLKRLGGPSKWAREASVVLAIVNHPAALERLESLIFELDLTDAGLKTLLGEAISAISADPGLDSQGLKSHLTQTGAAGSLERVLNDPELSKQSFLRPDAEIDEVVHGVSNSVAHHIFESVLKKEVVRSAANIFTDGEEEWKAAAIAREELINRSKDDRSAETSDEDSESRFNSVLDQWKRTGADKFNR
ncbi:MAG: DNA primase [Marinicaulis sp.]|nr:DNA primase [Marinicaulis sp.]